MLIGACNPMLCPIWGFRSLPIVTGEVGDCWIQGVASDPKKASFTRRMQNAFTPFADDRKLFTAATLLLKLTEHTWGGSGLVNASKNWTNAVLQTQLKNNSLAYDLRGFDDQRNFAADALAAVPKGHPLAAAWRKILERPATTAPSLAGFAETSTRSFKCRARESAALEFTSSGALLLDGLRIGELSYETLSEDVYNVSFPCTAAFGLKKGSAAYGGATRRETAKLSALYGSTAAAAKGCEFWAHVELTNVGDGAPTQPSWLHYTVQSDKVDVQLLILGKVPTRFNEAAWLAVEEHPHNPQHSVAWGLTKLGMPLSFEQVVEGGSPRLHAADSAWLRADSRAWTITSLDAPVVAPVTAALAPSVLMNDQMTRVQASNVRGVAFNLWNNMWSTNYLFFYPYDKKDQSFSYDFTVTTTAAVRGAELETTDPSARLAPLHTPMGDGEALVRARATVASRTVSATRFASVANKQPDDERSRQMLLRPYASKVSSARPVTSAEYDSPIPVLTPPTTVHVAIVADSVNGSRGLNLPPCAQQPGCSGNVSASCLRRQHLVLALTSFGGVSLRQGSSHGLFLADNTDQLRWLHRLAAVRPGLSLVMHPNETVWEVMAVMHKAQQLPLQYVQYDSARNRDSLAAARMATSRLNATMVDARLVAEAQAIGFRPAPTATAEGVTWSSDVRDMTAQKALDEWIAHMPTKGRLGLEQFTASGDPVQFQSDVASAWPLTSWGPEHRLAVAKDVAGGMPAGAPPLADKYMQSMAPDTPLFGNCHNRGLRESTMVRNTSMQSVILTVSEGVSNVPFYSSFRTADVSALRQNSTNRGAALPPHKHYVSFQFTDGDALDYTMAGMVPNKLTFWADPARGKFPVGWSLSGQMRDLIQPLIESLLTEANPTDENFMMDGWGYFAPSLMTAEARALDAKRALGVAADLNMSMMAMFSIDGDSAWDEVEEKWAPYGAGSLPLLEFWRQDQDGSECYVANLYSQRGALKWIGDTPVMQPRAALWSGGKLAAAHTTAGKTCPGLNQPRPTPPCPIDWYEGTGVCFQGCPKGSTKRDPTSQRCYCDAASPCLAGLDCIAIAGKAKKQCVCCGPKCADPHPGQCFDQPSLVKFLNAQPVSIDTAAGYSVVPVHVWAFNLSQLAAVVKQLGDHIEVVTPSELAYLIRKNVKRPLKTTDTIVHASFEAPVTVHVAPKTHAWFSALLSPGTGPLVVSCSLGGDGTNAKCSGTCTGNPVPNGCPKNGSKSAKCVMSKISSDGGKSWSSSGLNGWEGGNELMPLGTNGTFVTLPYTVNLDTKTNRTAASMNSYGRIDSAGKYTKGATFKMLFQVGKDPQFANFTWPSRLVHSGSVVRLKDGSSLTTMYGHGLGGYRNWSRMASVFFVRSTDFGREWTLRSIIPWLPVYGAYADGPGEPSTARLADGTLWCVFRSDSTQYYWSATSNDEGASWSNATKLPFAWSVKPRLRVTSKGLLVLTGGRPGIDLWASNDKGKSWTRFNIAAEHNRLLKAAGADKSLLFNEQVVNITSPFQKRAQPEPQTSSYTGLAEAADGAMVVSYDRICNGWKERVWAKNGSLEPGCWGGADVLFTMRVYLS